mmetsp:Transcript_49136/g.113550  ORF Transcript_49136/g.113550 Transcript_49136/m.113550 type:complete len:212 (+) Transcript_49136:320-955(+)
MPPRFPSPTRTRRSSFSGRWSLLLRGGRAWIPAVGVEMRRDAPAADERRSPANGCGAGCPFCAGRAVGFGSVVFARTLAALAVLAGSAAGAAVGSLDSSVPTGNAAREASPGHCPCCATESASTNVGSSAGSNNSASSASELGISTAVASAIAAATASSNSAPAFQLRLSASTATSSSSSSVLTHSASSSSVSSPSSLSATVTIAPTELAA